MTKKRLAFATGLALGTCAAAPAFAQQPAPNSYIDYLGVGVDVSQVSKLNDGTALVVDAGKNIRAVPGLAVEGEVTSSLNKPERSGGDISYWTAGAYGVYTLPVTQAFDVHGRLGALYEDVTGHGGASGRSEGKFSGGIGGTYRLTDRLGLRADYTRIDEDINHWGAGIEFRF